MRPVLPAALLATCLGLTACASTPATGAAPAGSSAPSSSGPTSSTAPITTAPAPPAPTPTSAAPAPTSAAPAPPAPPGARAEWTTYHGDLGRTGYAPGSPDPVNPRLAWTAQLDGAAYASPLVIGGLVVQATAGGSVYGLDAATGAVRWRTHVADPVPGDRLPCGNIDPLGITGTPAYDAATGQVFAVAAQAGPQVVVHVLYGIDARTGAIRSHRPVDAPGSEPATQLQRAALAVSGGQVVIAYGGNYGDCGAYLGRIVAVRTDGTGPLRAFAVPTRREAGIWAASGPAALPDGSLLVTTGNGEATGGAWDHSDSVLRLTPALEIADGFAPAEWAQENSVDADLGSTGPVVLPGGGQVVAAGKGGSVYLLDAAHLGGVGGQRSVLRGCRSYGGAAVLPGPGGAAVLLPCTEGLTQVLVGPDGLTRGWRAPTQVTGSPVVGGSTVWSLQSDGALYGLDAQTGAVRANLQVGDATRFATPALAGGSLFVGTRRGVTAVALAPAG